MTSSLADITIIGLGPGPAELRTVAVQNAIDAASRIFIRVHDGVDLDDILQHPGAVDVRKFRDQNAPHETRWQSVARAVCKAAGDGPVVLAIPGHPRFGEQLVTDTLDEAASHGLSTQVLDGISVVDLMATALGVDPMLDHIQFFDGRDVALQLPDNPFAGGKFTGSPRRPMLFTHVYDTTIIDGIAHALKRILPADHPVTRLEAAGMDGEQLGQLTVGTLADMPAGPLVGIYVPSLDALDAVRDPRTQQHITALLRAPGGCPWDREQTHLSLRDSIIEEAYEVVDAIDAHDPINLAEELGDLFLLICLHAQIAEEHGDFTLEDVFEGIATKIIRRHPHVFGDVVANNTEDLAAIWADVKAQEKLDQPDRPGNAGDSHPRSMPALARAARILETHPLDYDFASMTPQDRSRGLLDAIAAIVAAGDNPEQILGDALTAHIARRVR